MDRSPSTRSICSPKAYLKTRFRPQGQSLSTTGVNRDTLITIGWWIFATVHSGCTCRTWMAGITACSLPRPTKNTVFAYVGKRTTGTQAGDYLITGPGWKGAPAAGR